MVQYECIKRTVPLTRLTEPSTGNVYLYKEGGESILAINEQIKGDSGEIGNVGYQIIDEFDCRNSDLFKQMLP